MNLQSEVRALGSCHLGSYSVFSLQCLDAICFITAVLANDFDAVIKVSKLELLVQLDSELVDFYVSWGGLGEDTLHLQRDWSAVSLAFGAAERKNHLVLFVVISHHVVSHRKRH